jgi:HEAT repeat protein
VPELAKALSEEEERIYREYAALVLGQLNFVAKSALPALRKAAAEDKDERVRQACKAAIAKITK